MAAKNTQETQSQQSRPVSEKQSSGQTTPVQTQQNVQRDRERPVQTSREQVTSMTRRPSVSAIQPFGGGTPFMFMRRLSEDMDRLFADFGLSGALAPSLGVPGRDLWSEPLSTGTLWSPQIDLFRRGDNLVIRADLPGLSKDNITIDADDNSLTIRGERQQENEEDREGFYWNERSYGAFQRTIPLPEGANPDDAKAEFRDGVLEVTVPAPQRVQTSGRHIPIT
jgi:HSP20 family protein